MCSIGEEDFGDDGAVHGMEPTVEELYFTAAEGICSKCGVKVTEIYKLPFRETECRECFLFYVRHKFRAALGSSKILPRNAKVLLAFDGSAASMVLLDMLSHAQQQNSYKRLHCLIQILVLDDLHLIQPGINEEDYIKQLHTLQDYLLKFEQFDSWLLPFATAADISQLQRFTELQAYLAREQNKEKEMLQCVNNMRSFTSKQDYIKQQRNVLLSVAAKQLQCGFVFMCQTSNKLAADLLSAVALGRGGSSAFDVALVDERAIIAAGVRLVRPLRDLNETEVALYMRAQNLQLLQSQEYVEQKDAEISLQLLSKQFINNLQKNFASTVSTVFRTGNKIAPNVQLQQKMQALKLSQQNISTCAFCNSAFDYDSSTLLAMEFSRLASETGSTITEVSYMNRLANDNLLKLSNYDLNQLCHACCNLKRDGANLAIS